MIYLYENEINMISILVVGCGNMGASHAMAYENHHGFTICGLVSRGNSKEKLNAQLKGDYPLYVSFEEALEKEKPKAVCIATYPETHEPYTLKALEAGLHVFLEKPIATSVEGGQRILKKMVNTQKKVMIGYILRHHPVWKEFIAQSKTLGKPLVMRMNLNQQSRGIMWGVHQNLMQSLSPIVDCGVHYLDVMCQMTSAVPLSVSAIGVRLTDAIPENNYNYGQLQIRFKDGSVGWYEAGWGPMVSETAHFIKDVFGPKGSVSLLQEAQQTDAVEGHTQTDIMKIHRASIDKDNQFIYPDEKRSFDEAPSHQDLCDFEQQYFYHAITNDLDLSTHVQEAIDSLAIALACDIAVKSGETVYL